jgi:hypothetical protein
VGLLVGRGHGRHLDLWRDVLLPGDGGLPDRSLPKAGAASTWVSRRWSWAWPS